MNPQDAADAEGIGMKAEGGRRKAADSVSILHFAFFILPSPSASSAVNNPG